jgi:SOS-response transcriptional repressor LexA
MTNARELTPRQSQVLELIRKRVREGRPPPTLREIGRELADDEGREKAYLAHGVRQIVGALEKHGHIKRGSSGRARSLELTEPEVMAIADVEAQLADALGCQPASLAELLERVSLLVCR